MQIEGLEVNSPEYWEIRHQREPWPRTSSWALEIVIKQIEPGSTVLDVGCGQGAFAAKIKAERPDLEVMGIDCSPTAIEKAHEAYPRVDFRVADVFKLKTELNVTFDYITTIQNFEHWPIYDQIPAMRAMWSRLKPGGKIFFTGVGKAWDLDEMNYSPMEYDGKAIMVPNDYHYNNWSEQEVYDLFNNDACKAQSVKFWRRRRKNRVIAEATKS